MSFTLGPLREILISVQQPQAWLTLFRDYGGWDYICNATSSRTWLEQWGLATDQQTDEHLLRFQGLEHGAIRLIQYQPSSREQMRPSGKIWDTGGISDIDIRVHNILHVFHDLVDEGWHGANIPMDMPAPPFKLDEVLLSGPDGVMLALVQRHFPSIDLPLDKNLASQVYLSAMTVKDLAGAAHFFIDQLGFVKLNQIPIRFPANQMNNFGLPHNFSDAFTCNLCMFSPDGSREAMLQVMSFDGLVGSDFSDRMKAPYRGIQAYRIEVNNLLDYRDQLIAHGLACPTIVQDEWQPYGPVRFFKIASPEMAWVEFFEVI